MVTAISEWASNSSWSYSNVCTYFSSFIAKCILVLCHKVVISQGNLSMVYAPLEICDFDFQY